MRVRTGAVWAVALIVMLAGSNTHAAFNELAIAAKAGTLGIGGDLTTNLIPQVNLRGGVQWLGFGFDAEFGDIDYELDLDFLNPLVLIDWYPFNGAFRISGGVLFNGCDIQLEASSDKSVEIDGVLYEATDYGTLRGDVEWRPIAPYVGIGWGNQLDKKGHWGLATDLGVAFTGSPDVDLSATGPIAADADFRARLAHEEKDIQDELDTFKFFPVLSISLFYRF